MKILRRPALDALALGLLALAGCGRGGGEKSAAAVAETPSATVQAAAVESAAAPSAQTQTQAEEPEGCCGMGPHRGMGRGGMRGGMGGMRGGMGGVMREAMMLVHAHESITRKVEEIPGGVRTTNTTTNPAMVETLRQHPRNMKAFYDQGGSVRHWDPLFVELAKHSGKIKMTFRDIENGIEVESTSDDPAVTALIRAHAYKVNEFVSRGMPAVHESSPMPEGYTAGGTP